MPIDFHTIEAGDGSTFSFTDRVKVWNFPGLTNAAGGSAGASVMTAVSVSNVALPASYTVLVGGISQNATAAVTSKTASGFNVVLTPLLAANTLERTTMNALITFPTRDDGLPAARRALSRLMGEERAIDEPAGDPRVAARRRPERENASGEGLVVSGRIADFQAVIREGRSPSLESPEAVGAMNSSFGSAVFMVRRGLRRSGAAATL